MAEVERRTAKGCVDSFDGLRDGLAAWLEQEIALCARLLEVAQEKHRILLAGPGNEELAANLERIVREEEALFARWKELCEETAQPEGYRETISRIPEGDERFQRLCRMVQELQDLNRENAEILKRFQRYVDFMVGLLEKRAGMSTYGENDGKLGRGRRSALNLSRISRQV